MQQTFGNGGHLAKGNYKNFENAERAVNDSFISFLMDLRFTFYFYNLYTRYILYFSIVCTYWNERLSERVYRLTRKIEKSCHSLHIWLHDADKDRSPLFNPITAATLLIYIYGTVYVYSRNCLKMKNLLEKNSNICRTLYAFQKFILFFSRFKICIILIYQRCLYVFVKNN